MNTTTRFLTQRRDFLKGMALTATAVASAPLFTACSPADFAHGVASGDPLTDRVIIWTRVTPDFEAPVLVCWEIARDKSFKKVIARGETYTDDSVDYSVKVDADGLQPGKKYFYRFKVDGTTSPVGVTRTLPRGHINSLRFAVFSCSNYPAGYFHVYKLAAEGDFDFALHLGDYIYEYAKDGYASEQAEALGRVVEPETEILTLSDYRSRYAVYRSDKDLQLAHRKLQFIVVWDDHEVTNDTWKAGAENHQQEEGDFFQRRDAAIQAYYEWMPIRETNPEAKEKIYRSFDFGDLLSLHMLDTRIIGRDQQLAYPDYFKSDGSFDAAAFTTDLSDPARTILGSEQTTWLSNALAASRATWQLFGQQVLMAAFYLPAPLIFQTVSLGDYLAIVTKAQANPSALTPEELAVLNAPSVPFNLDAWDGYPVSRETVLKAAAALDKNLISLAGDTHNAWASQLDTQDGQAVGVEFATPSVSSPGAEEYLPTIPPEQLAAALTQFIEPLVYAETAHRGFLALTVSHEQTVGEWIFVDTVKSKQWAVREDLGRTLKVLPGAGNRRLIEA